MEYLMTYGWAILIIAVVLGALYSLGVFSGSSLTPRAQPGSCKVIRPNGPGTTTFINLAGVCTGQLPQFVAQFNGQSYVTAGNSISLQEPTAISVGFWTKFNGANGNWQEVLWKRHDDGGGAQGWQIFLQKNSNTLTASRWLNGVGVSVSATYTPNTWYHWIWAYDGSNQVLYRNGVIVAGPTPDTNTVDTNTNLLMGVSSPSLFDALYGFVTNVQIYNTSLNQNEIQGLYVEGMGGAPTRLQNLVGWWPLNGDAKDYSGNGNNGASTNVVFTSTWTR